MQIYLARNNVQAGPYTLEQLNTMLASGEVSLEDLMWHSGMSQWQRLGDMTGNQLHYAPNNAVSAVQPPLASTQAKNAQDIQAFGDNPEFQDGAPKRVSVDELYGRKPSASQPNQQQAQQIQKASQHAGQSTQAIVYASISSRLLAMLINLLLFVLTLVPFLQAFLALNPDVDKMQSVDFATRVAYAQELADKIPSSAASLTGLLLLGYLIIQLLLMVMRNQSFGKLAVGIRVVDAKTHQKPSFAKGFLVRVLLLWLIYWVLLSLALPVNLALVAIIINYIYANYRSDKQGWHDKLSGTVVIKSNSQKQNKP